MPKMTWLELKNLIDKSVIDKDSNVVVYDMSTGDLLDCDFIELKEDHTWKPTIGINLEHTESE